MNDTKSKVPTEELRFVKTEIIKSSEFHVHPESLDRIGRELYYQLNAALKAIQGDAAPEVKWCSFGDEHESPDVNDRGHFQFTQRYTNGKAEFIL